MAFYTNHIDTPDQQGVLGALRKTLGQMFESIADAQNRSNAVARMERMSDAELERLGVSRTEIVRYVYRDLLHV